MMPGESPPDSVCIRRITHVYDYNFGQYIMLWDQVFGYFREYTEPKMARAKAA